MASKKIEIVYDINNKPIDVAVESTLNLKQQVRELTKEINKTKEGTEEFRLLSAKLNETRDNMDRVKAKSGELFNTLSLLPGPVGDFGNQIDNSINLLKTFSGFSLKDITNQLKELGKDALDIVKNILGLNVAQKALAVSEAEATTGAVAETAALEGQAVATEAAEVATIGLGTALKAIGIGLLIAGIALLIAYWDDLKDAIGGTSEETKRYSEASQKAAEKSGEQITQLEILTQQVKAGTLSQREKNQAVNDYNDKLGDTLGKVKSYAELEAKLITNGPKYIQYLKTKALAEAAYQLAIEKGKEALKKSMENPESNAGWQDYLSGFLESKDFSRTLKVQGEVNRGVQVEALNKQKESFLDIFKTAQADADALANDLKLKVPEIKYSGDTKTNTTKEDPKVKAKKDALDLINKYEEEAYTNSLSNRNKELYDLGKKYNEALVAAKKYGIDTTLIKEQNAAEEAKINKKYDDEDAKNKKDRLEKEKEFWKKAKEDADEKRKKKFEDDVKAMQDELDVLEAQQKTLMAGTQAYTDNSIAIENKAYEIKLKNAKDNALQIQAITTEHEQNLKNIKLAAFIAEKQIDIERVQSIANIGSSLKELAGENKEVAIAGIIVEKAAAIAGIILNTQIANEKALATLGPIAGPVWVGVNSVAAGLSVAAATVAATKAISEINGAGSGSSSSAPAANSTASLGRNYGNGGLLEGPRHAAGGMMINAEGGEAVMTRGAVTMFAPLLSTLNQMGGGTSFGKGVVGQANYDAPMSSNSNTPIIKTYVVSNELTSQAEKNARLKDLSTL
jgi:hypothetical protein